MALNIRSAFLKLLSWQQCLYGHLSAKVSTVLYSLNLPVNIGKIWKSWGFPNVFEPSLEPYMYYYFVLLNHFLNHWTLRCEDSNITESNEDVSDGTNNWVIGTNPCETGGFNPVFFEMKIVYFLRNCWRVGQI